jgi:hypothetical protein
MTDKLPFDLDAALAALARDERAARPRPSQGLVARVLSDAAEIGAPRPAAPASPPARAPGIGWLRIFGFSDAWAGAAVTATLLVLAAGFGVGYEAGPELLADTGLDAAFGGGQVMLADAGDGLFDTDDVL